MPGEGRLKLPRTMTCELLYGVVGNPGPPAKSSKGRDFEEAVPDGEMTANGETAIAENA